MTEPGGVWSHGGGRGGHSQPVHGARCVGHGQDRAVPSLERTHDPWGHVGGQHPQVLLGTPTPQQHRDGLGAALLPFGAGVGSVPALPAPGCKPGGNAAAIFGRRTRRGRHNGAGCWQLPGGSGGARGGSKVLPEGAWCCGGRGGTRQTKASRAAPRHHGTAGPRPPAPRDPRVATGIPVHWGGRARVCKRLRVRVHGGVHT